MTATPATRRQELWEFVRASGLRSVVVGVSKDPNAKITLLLLSPHNGRPQLAVKAPTTDAGARAIETEARVLEQLRRLRPRRVFSTVPRVVGEVEFEGRGALVMSAVEGTPMTTTYLRRGHTADRVRVAADLRALDRWLTGLQRDTAAPAAPLEMDAGVTRRLAERFRGQRSLARDLERLRQIHERLRCQRTPRTTVHGDLWPGNVLTTQGRASGVVDWEAGCERGEPARDLARFAHMYALYLDRRTSPGRRVRGHPGLRAGPWGAGLAYALDGRGWFPDLYRGFLRKGLARLGADSDCWRDLALAGVAEVAALTDDGSFAQRHLDLFRRLAARPDGKETP